MEEAIRRRIRRSHFMLNEGLVGILKYVNSTGEPASSATSRGVLMAAGASAAVATAYFVMKKAEENVAEARNEGPVKPEEIKAVIEANPADVRRGAQESDSLWQRAKSLFKKEEVKKADPPKVEKGMVAAKPSGLAPLAEGFRTKFDFTGFPGADALSKGGSFTATEVQVIIALKNNGTNTKAFSKMPDSIRDKIVAYARMHGVDEVLALKIAQVESGGNPYAVSSTGALGVYQFTGGTANDAGISNRFDEDQNIEAGVLNLKKNSQSDIAATATNIYLMHQLGRKGARELIEAAQSGKKIAQLSKSLQRALAKNFGGSSAVTAQDYIAQTEAFLEDKSSGIAFNTIAPATPTKSTLSTGNVAGPAPVVVATRAPATSTPSSVPPPPLRSTAPARNVASSQTVDSNIEMDDGGNRQSQMPQSVARTRNGILIGTS